MSNVKSINRIIYQLFEILNTKQRRQAVLVCMSMILSSVLELLSVSVIYPFLNLMLDKESAYNTWYVSLICSLLPGISFDGIIMFFGGVIILIFILKNIAALFFAYLQYQFGARFSSESSTLMLESYMRRPYEYFANHNSAELLRGINSDTSSVYAEIIAAFQLVGEVLTVTLLSGYLFKTSWEIAIGALALAFICFIAIVLGFKQRIKDAAYRNREATKNRNQYSLQAIHGIKEIMVSGRQDYFIVEFNKAADEMARANLSYNMISSCPDRLLEGICMSGFIGIVCVRVALGVEMASFIPVLGAFAMGAFRVLPSISKVSNRINSLVFYQPGLQHCYENILEARAIEKGNDDVRRRNDLLNYSLKFDNQLFVNNIKWKYSNSSDYVLDGLSLTINKGESVALIGSSGAGKTTLADIILGLYRPQEGCIEMDGTDIANFPSDWSRIIGYVPQSVYLVDDTIRANVAFGIERSEVSDDRVWHSLYQAQMSDYIEELPEGIDTYVGEHGVRFSGGQKQRIAIARALYDDPEIIVFDEATSALDVETETAVIESIDSLRGKKTMIIIAHRLSTIRNCDRIFEIINGKAIERKHDEVFSKSRSKTSTLTGG